MFNLANAAFSVRQSIAKHVVSCTRTFVYDSLNQRSNSHTVSSCFKSLSRSPKAPSSKLEKNFLIPNNSNTPLITMVVKKYSSSNPEENVDAGHVSSFYDRYVFPEPPELVSEEEHDIVIEEVNKCMADVKKGRLFAIVAVTGRQFKVTDNDLIRVVGELDGVALGEKVRLEKVLAVGGRDFTLIGRPLVRRSLVKVEATVIEMTPGAEKVIQRFQPRKSFERRYIFTPTYTVIRINSVEAYPGLE